MFLGFDTATWASLGVWAQVLVILVSAGFVFWQVWEARKLRLEQTRPHVVVSLQIEQRIMVMLVVENLGATTAKDVAIEFEPQPKLLDGELAVQHRPIPTLPPGMKLRSHLGQGFKLLDDNYDGPRQFTATATYSDARGRPLPPDKYRLDIGMFDGYAVDLKSMNELVDEVAKIQRTLRKVAISDRLDGLERANRAEVATAETTTHGESFVSRVLGGLFGRGRATS